MFDKDSPKGLDTFVRFKLKNYSKLSLEETETIVEVQEDDCIVEGRYFNEFIAIQRILEFGSSCVVLSPDGFKAKIIEKLKKMRAMYVSK
jgi:predicted DNA-binding transcriptional regulator YafY